MDTIIGIFITTILGIILLIVLIALGRQLNVHAMWLIISLGFIGVQSIINVFIGRKIYKWYKISIDLKPRLEGVEERVKSICYYLKKDEINK